jgi:hypothetical protein
VWHAISNTNLTDFLFGGILSVGEAITRRKLLQVYPTIYESAREIGFRFFYYAEYTERDVALSHGSETGCEIKSI